MSQDAHTFSVRRTRETLGGINNNVSAIPMPMSAMKRSASNQNLQAGSHVRSTSGSRMSLAPSRPNQPVFQRGSTIGYDNAPHSAQRPGTSLFGASSQSARKSMAPFGSITPAHGLATPAPDTLQRRSSIYSARPSSGPGTHSRMSFFAQAPAPAGVPVDPRRLREVGTKNQMAQELLDYMTRNNFEMDMQMPLSSKSMSSPTQKEFNAMFKWLYNRIDPAYRFQKSIDAEIPVLLKQMRYPFEKSITKSQITAVGGNNWHTFLGLLHWIMQLAHMMDAYAAGSYDEACLEAGAPVREDRIIFEFISDAYRAWLNVPEDADDEVADRAVQDCVDTMAQRFKDLNKDMLDDVQMLEAEKKALMEQIEELERNAEKGRKLDVGIQTVAGDIEKFEAWNNKVSSRIKSKNQKIGLLEEDIKKLEDEVSTTEAEKQGYQEELGRRGISIQDLDRMSAERERLEKSREAAGTRLEDCRGRVAEMEAEATKKLDELERLVERYNSLCYKINLIPTTAANAKGVNYELCLQVNSQPSFGSSQMGSSQAQSEPERLLRDSTSGYMPDQLLNLDLKGAVKANISALRKEVSERRTAALEEDMRNHDLLDNVREAMDDKQSEVEGLGHRIRAAEEEFEKTKEITTAQKMTLDAQIERMEKELSKLRAGLTESVQMMEQREINTNLEYEQLTIRAASLREELHTEVERILNDVIKFKIHIQQKLEEYEAFVDEEVSREFEAMAVGDPIGEESLQQQQHERDTGLPLAQSPDEGESMVDGSADSAGDVSMT